jgi:hypothetical protein
LLGVDAQMQCTNQGCNYYGKLICAVCDPAVEHEEPPSVYAEPEDGYWPAWLLLVLTVSAVIWWFTSFLAAAAIAVAAYAGGGYVLHRAGVNLFGRQRKVEYKRKSTFHTCIKCQRQVKALRGEDAS